MTASWFVQLLAQRCTDTLYVVQLLLPVLIQMFDRLGYLRGKRQVVAAYMLC